MYTMEEVQRAYESGHYRSNLIRPTRISYPDAHIFDADQSVKWNKEQVKIKNEELKQQKTSLRDDEYRLTVQLKTDMATAISSEYKEINEEQAALLYEFVYQREHDNMHNFFIALEENCDLYVNVLNKQGVKL
jgi:hypothetical protein